MCNSTGRRSKSANVSSTGVVNHDVHAAKVANGHAVKRHERVSCARSLAHAREHATLLSYSHLRNHCIYAFIFFPCGILGHVCFDGCCSICCRHRLSVLRAWLFSLIRFFDSQVAASSVKPIHKITCSGQPYTGLGQIMATVPVNH